MNMVYVHCVCPFVCPAVCAYLCVCVCVCREKCRYECCNMQKSDSEHEKKNAYPPYSGHKTILFVSVRTCSSRICHWYKMLNYLKKKSLKVEDLFFLICTLQEACFVKMLKVTQSVSVRSNSVLLTCMYIR